MKIEFPYGKEKLKAEIPEDNLIGILERERKEGVGDGRKIILNSLRNPVGSPPLRELVKTDDVVTIIVNDNTRPSPENSSIVLPLIEELKSSGVQENNIKIVIAYGLHPPLDKDGLIELLGKEVIENYEIIHHESENTANLGKSSRGIPVEVNKHVVNADFKIATGLIEPHFFAGYSGGRKSIMPGVSSREAIYGNHGFKMIDHPNSKPGVLEKNPIHEDSEEHSKKVGLDFILNVVLNKDNEILKVVSGDPVDAYSKGVEFEQEIAEIETDRKADIVVTTNSGAPLDLDLYQTVKGIYHASLVTKKDGIIITASKCYEGVGPTEFKDLHKRGNSPQNIIDTIRKEEPIGVQWENQILAQVQTNQNIYLKSSLDDEEVERFMITPIKKIEKGIKIGFEKLGQDAEILAIPEGPMVVPKTY